MKTAVQELVDELLFIESIKENEITKSNKAILTTAAIKQAFEKEKEQIMDAYDRGYKACDLDEALEINKTMFSGERYYEQTYKPETI